MAQGVQCIEPADLADATTYTIPLMLQSAQASCADVLRADSFVLSQGSEFAARFEPLRDAAWPGTRRVLVNVIENKTGVDRAAAEQAPADAGGVMQMLMRMEGDELRPFLDALATQMIAGEIKPQTCMDIETLLPLLAPLPAENYGALVSAILGLVAGDADDDLPICTAASR